MQEDIRQAILSKATEVVIDKPRRLLVTLGALAEIETLTGQSVLQRTNSVPSTKNLFIMLAAFCRFEDPDVSPAQLAKGFSMGRMPIVMKALTEAYSRNVIGTPADGQSESFQTADTGLATASA